MRHLVRLAPSAVGIAVMLAIAVVPIDRVEATTCVAYDATDLLTSDMPGLTLFIGTVTASADPVEFAVDAVMKGGLAGSADVRMEADFAPDVRERFLLGSTWLVAAFVDANGSLVAGPCLWPQPIYSLEAAEQVIALAPEADVRSTFGHLPPATKLRLGVAPPPDVVSHAPLPSAESIPVAPRSGSTSVPVGVLAAVAAVGGILSMVLWLVVRRPRLALLIAGFSGLVVLALAVMAADTPAEPGPSAIAEASPTPSIDFEPLALPPADREPDRDGPGLARLLDRAGLSCVTAESQIDNWRSWDCGGIATPDIEVLVSMGSNFGDDHVISYAVSYTDRSDNSILEPIEPAEFEPFTDLVLEPAQRTEIRDWMARTWAISSVNAELDEVFVRRYGASLTLDLRFTAP